jgi:hypothetical protein
MPWNPHPLNVNNCPISKDYNESKRFILWLSLILLLLLLLYGYFPGTLRKDGG